MFAGAREELTGRFLNEMIGKRLPEGKRLPYFVKKNIAYF